MASPERSVAVAAPGPLLLSDMHRVAVVSTTGQQDTARHTTIEMWAGSLPRSSGEPKGKSSDPCFSLACVKRTPVAHRERLEREAARMYELASALGNHQARVHGLAYDANSALLVTEFLPLGDVFMWQASRFPFGADTWMRDALQAVRVLHVRHLAHTDLSAENMACRPDGSCVLLDLEHVCCSRKPVAPALLSTKRRYRAPEFRKGRPISTTRADLFALGVVCSEILVGPIGHQPGQGVLEDCPSSWEACAERIASTMGRVAQAGGPWTHELVIPLLALQPVWREGASAEMSSSLPLLVAPLEKSKVLYE